ncbi:MAG: peroxiredoxin [Hyphomonadaceae bacterium]|nr:peroxiredoxin [Hyphomonadaceae bacterium]
MGVGLDPGDKAPAFKLPVAGGGHVSLGGLKGKIVVLFFYPKDDTSACTQEALSFTEKADEFEALGAVVIGVSRDPVRSHDRFMAKHGLRLTLGSDEDGAVTERYGVWVEKTLYGRKYMGIERATFLIDRSGKVVKTWRKVKVKGHVEEVLAATRQI